MTKIIYVCEGECHGQTEPMTEEPESTLTCKAETCNRHGLPLTKHHICEKCNAKYKEGEEHSC